MRRPDDDIGEISGMGIWDGTGVVILKNGVSEALLNRVLCQALRKCWVLEHDVLRVVSPRRLSGRPVSLCHLSVFIQGTVSREASIGEAGQAGFARRALAVRDHRGLARGRFPERNASGQPGGLGRHGDLSVNMDCRDAPTDMS